MSLFEQLMTGTFMIGTTVFLHALGLDFIIQRAGIAEKLLKAAVPALWRPVLSAVVVVTVFSLHVVNIWLWAFLYEILDCKSLGGFSSVLSYSTGAYTTFGDTEVKLDPALRLLGSIEAANGVLLFGWTTAFIFEVVSQFHRREVRSLSD